MEIEKYRLFPFQEISKDQYFSFNSVRDLVEKCNNDKHQLTKCRTLGILGSDNGSFYLRDLDLPLYKSNMKIRISLVYVTNPLKTTTMPQPVQIFGTLQWSNEPTVFVKTLQILDVPTAIKLRDIMKCIADDHLAIPRIDLNTTEHLETADPQEFKMLQ